MTPNLDCNELSSIDLAPNGILFGTTWIGLVKLQSKLRLIQENSETISPCVYWNLDIQHRGVSSFQQIFLFSSQIGIVFFGRPKNLRLSVYWVPDSGAP